MTASDLPARVVNVPSIVAGEHAENEIRKEFTPMERVAIGRALEAEMPERRIPQEREKTDLGPGSPTNGETRDTVDLVCPPDRFRVLGDELELLDQPGDDFEPNWGPTDDTPDPDRAQW